VDVIVLHRDHSRHELFPVAKPIFFDRTINAWVIVGPRQCEAILVSPHVEVAPYRSTYERMAAEDRNFAFNNLIFAFQYLPLCINGEEHRLVRRQVAEFLGARKAIAEAAAPNIVERWLAVLQAHRKVELMGEVIKPMVKQFVATLTGIEAAHLIQSSSTIFDRMMGAKRRRNLDDEIGAIRACIRKTLGADSTLDHEGVRLALFILGNDALAGTFGESLYQLLRHHPNSKLSEIDYPVFPLETSVAFAERFVTEPFQLEGVNFREGERLRIMLQSFAYSAEAADRARIFGAGIHTCLGRQVSLELWSVFTRNLSRIEASVEILDYALRDDDYIFTHPAKLMVRVKL
jgi:cytochrome P450